MGLLRRRQPSNCRCGGRRRPQNEQPLLSGGRFPRRLQRGGYNRCCLTSRNNTIKRRRHIAGRRPAVISPNHFTAKLGVVECWLGSACPARRAARHISVPFRLFSDGGQLSDLSPSSFRIGVQKYSRQLNRSLPSHTLVGVMRDPRLGHQAKKYQALEVATICHECNPI